MSADPLPAKRIGYCTNVHPGRTLAETRDQLDRHAAAVREQVAPRGALNVGLWLSAAAVSELDSPAAVDSFKAWLDARRLRVFTLNGFPYGDFHGAVVKHRVYEPSWSDPHRLDYTLALARLLAALVDEGEHAGISTLPLGWPGAPCAAVDTGSAVGQLRTAAAELNRIAAETGRLLHLDIEPEPGCILSTSSNLCAFYREQLLGGVCEAEERIIRRHIRVCHDVCHAAVMFEPQREALDRYAADGIEIGKVQISSAIEAGLPADISASEALLEALQPFAEDRYLHQTSIRRDGLRVFYEDLPAALAQAPSGTSERWRIHYHVPISAERLGPLGTTQAAITECLRILAEAPVRDLEIETYTWGVLPQHERPGSIADGISGEMKWLLHELGRLGIPCEAGA